MRKGNWQPPAPTLPVNEETESEMSPHTARVSAERVSHRVCVGATAGVAAGMVVAAVAVAMDDGIAVCVAVLVLVEVGVHLRNDTGVRVHVVAVPPALGIRHGADQTLDKELGGDVSVALHV